MFPSLESSRMLAKININNNTIIVRGVRTKGGGGGGGGAESPIIIHTGYAHR